MYNIFGVCTFQLLYLFQYKLIEGKILDICRFYEIKIYICNSSFLNLRFTIYYFEKSY